MSSLANFRIEHNVQTNEILIVELSKSEIAELEAAQTEATNTAKAEAEAQAAKAAAKATAEAKLTALGLTSDDLRALGL